jgi:septum formation protein
VPERPYPGDFVLLLASRSPRRRELLEAAGVPHRVIHSQGEERSSGSAITTLAEGNAESKARGAVVPDRTPKGAFVLGADTVVVVSGRILGKPACEDEAGEMLALLAGRRHEVVSGVSLGRWDGSCVSEVATASAVTGVEFCALDAGDIRAYLDSGDWQGKAGAYAIQGRAALFVTGIRGGYSNVVGLPLELLARLFEDHGFDLLRRSWRGGREGGAG